MRTRSSKCGRSISGRNWFKIYGEKPFEWQVDNIHCTPALVVNQLASVIWNMETKSKNGDDRQLASYAFSSVMKVIIILIQKKKM